MWAATMALGARGVLDGWTGRLGGCLYRHRSADVSPTAARARTSRQLAGDEAEAIAQRHLERHGLRPLAANVRYSDGELDLVMSENGRDGACTLVFVEVRRRTGSSHGGALGSVTAAKRRRLVSAAARYLVASRWRTPPACRFDLVTLQGEGRYPTIEWHRDAFRADG